MEEIISSAIALTDDLDRLLANIAPLTRRIEESRTARIANESSATTSTPRWLRGVRRRLPPVEGIVLSNLDRPATNRAPDAGIDLSSPRRNSQQSTSAAIDDGPPPPKPNCDQSQKEEPYKCPVCLESVRMREPVSTTCGHVFCKDCLIAAIRSFAKCPMCNKKLTEGQFSRIYL